jgi:hypothetical protein
MNAEAGELWEELFRACFRVIYQYLLGGIEENCEISVKVVYLLKPVCCTS